MSEFFFFFGFSNLNNPFFVVFSFSVYLVSNILKTENEPEVQFTLTAVTHPEDGLVTSTLIVPAFVTSFSTVSLGSFMGFLNWAQSLSPEEQSIIVSQPASAGDWTNAIFDSARTAVVCAAFTVGVAGVNHLLCRKVLTYRQANAAVTTAIDFAPNTTLASTVAFGLYGVALVAANSPPPPVSVFTMLFITHWSVGTVALQSMAGRFVGHAVAASWFGVEKLRQRQAAEQQKK